MTPDYRAHLDFRISFANGGGLTAEGFRLDVAGADVREAEVARSLVQHLGLALVESVEFSNFVIVEEQHRGSRGVHLERAAGGRVVDLSHPIREGLVTYPGLPAPTITPFLTREDSRARYAEGTTFAMDMITMIGNTGTYLDSPFHRYGEGVDLAGLALSSLVDIPAEVFHLTDSWSADRRGIGALTLADRDVHGKAVLFHTGWDRHFGTPAYGTGSPFIAPDAVEWLVASGAVLVGIDALNVDDTESGGERPAHSGLLAAGIHVVEHLTGLEELPPSGARFFAPVPAVEDFGTFPVRAFAIV